ncbi:hypothetical protein [Litorisediminicola beolgyonensis]|uniref:Uncharacterized protein n=1 Tax=Litorisediminicola beolgyonensis TaxID=1173614 RepID=A0ABW3ZF17_9RHOB
MFGFLKKRGENAVILKDGKGKYFQKDIGVEAGYELGLAQLNSRMVDGSKGGVFYLLPLAIRDFNGGVSKSYEDLTPEERGVVEHLYRVIVPGNVIPHAAPPPGPNGLWNSLSVQKFLTVRGGWKFKARPLLGPVGDDFVNKRVPREAILSMVEEILSFTPKEERVSFDLTDSDGLKAAKETRDPHIFHHMAVYAAAYDPDPERLLTWLIGQPELDRGTAAWLIDYLGLDAWISGIAPEHGVMGAQGAERVLRQICVRADERGFQADVVGLDPGISFGKLEEAHAKNGMPNGVPWPASIVNSPYPEFSPGPYDVGEDGVLVQY